MSTSARSSRAPEAGASPSRAAETADSTARDLSLQSVLDAMIDPFVLLAGVRDDQGRLIDLRYVAANDIAVQYNHLTREQMIGTRLLDLFPGQLEHGPLRQYFRTIDTGEPTVLDGYAYPHEILGQERRYDIRATKAGDGLTLTWRDVTDRYRAAEKLAESERLYRLLAENSSDVFLLSEDSRTFSWISDSAEAVLGYPPADLVGTSPADYVHPDDLPALLADIAASERTGQVARVRTRWRLPDGSYCWVESAGRPILDTDGATTGGRVITIHRVDEQVQAREDLLRQEQQYQLLAENVSDAILLADAAGVCTWASESAPAVLGWPIDDILGRTISECVDPDDLAALAADIAYMDATGGTIRTRVRWRLPDQGYCWVEAAGRPLLDDDGALTGHVTTFHRIDDQVRAEQELERSEHFYRLLTENSSDVILLAEKASTQISWVSPSVTTTLGWVPGDLTGQPAIEFIHPDDLPDLGGDASRQLEAGEEIAYRYRWRTALGDYHWMDGRARLVDPADPEGQRVVRLRDVDDQVRAEQGLAESESHYRLLADNSTDVIFLADGEGRLRWASASARQVLGWRTGDMVGHLATDFLHPDDVARLREAISGSTASGAESVVRYRWRRADGSYVWVEGAGRPVTDESGAVRRVVRLRDIDDQMAAEQELEASEELYRLIAENSSDVVILADDEARALWVSPSVTATLGWQQQDFVGHQAHEFMHPDDWPADDHLEEDRSAYFDRTMRYRIRLADGSYRWFEAVARMVPTLPGAPRRHVARLRDIDNQVRAERDLAASEELYRLLTENSSDIIVLADQEGRALWVSPALERGLGWTAGEMIGHLGTDFIHPDDVPGMLEALRRSVESGGDARLHYRMRAKDGTYHWFDASGSTLPADDRGRVRRVVRLRDIDEQVEAERSLAVSESTYRVLAENASDVVWQVDEDGQILWISPSVTAVLGWPTEELVSTATTDLIVPEDRGRYAELVEAVRRGRSTSGEFRVVTSSGSPRWMEISLRNARAEDSAARIGTLRDIDDVVQARRNMEFLLQHDQATGLPTRGSMMERVSRLQQQMSPRDQMAVLTVGVDHLKDVNDAFGHHVGDAVIATLAGRIGLALENPEALGRGNGDEFIAMIDDASDPVLVAQVAERIRTQAHGEIDILGHNVDPTVSIGIARGTHRADAEALLRESTLAMHHAKSQGRDRWVFADPELAQQAAQRMAVESAIRVALDRSEFVAWYQPVVDLHDSHVVGYEALVRWLRDDRVILPDDFLPVAERTGLIASIDTVMAELVVARLATLPEHEFIALNVTGFTLRTTPYADHVADLLSQHGVSPSRLHLEITETRLFRIEPVIVEQIQQLAGLGVRWYVDDFGTGFSSISHLRDLPVWGLKLDKSFTQGIREGEEKSRNLADALMGLANGLGLDTVAEGIETAAEAAYLRTLGWRHGQGWLYGKAAPLE